MTGAGDFFGDAPFPNNLIYPFTTPPIAVVGAGIFTAAAPFDVSNFISLKIAATNAGPSAAIIVFFWADTADELKTANLPSVIMTMNINVAILEFAPLIIPNLGDWMTFQVFSFDGGAVSLTLALSARHQPANIPTLVKPITAQNVDVPPGGVLTNLIPVASIPASYQLRVKVLSYRYNGTPAAGSLMIFGDSNNNQSIVTVAAATLNNGGPGPIPCDMVILNNSTIAAVNTDAAVHARAWVQAELQPIVLQFPRGF